MEELAAPPLILLPPFALALLELMPMPLELPPWYAFFGFCALPARFTLMLA